MDLQEALRRVVDGHDLSRAESAGVMKLIMSGDASPALVSGLLVALRMKGETTEEITGFAETMRSMATRVPANRRPLVDTCGTGGDGAGTFNISTTAAFVVAGAGVAVAKHGNRAASSQCGSADVLEALGVKLDLTPEAVGRCIDAIGIGFLYARALHGAMKHVAPVRADLKIRTIFNMLGPLTNPANADGQVVGVFDRDRAETLARVLANLGVRRAFVVAGMDGLDEITVTGPTYVAEANAGHVKVYELLPEDAGIPRTPDADLSGGNAVDNAAITRDVLLGVPGPRRDIVVLNAAAALLAGEAAHDWKSAAKAAAESIDSGAAMRKLDELVRFTTELAA
ncbi:MAG: anthranilate phosphoribosyltransferase [Candidatus Hydrogenedentota bacterium]